MVNSVDDLIATYLPTLPKDGKENTVSALAPHRKTADFGLLVRSRARRPNALFADVY
jgi:hypothetical protein